MPVDEDNFQAIFQTRFEKVEGGGIRTETGGADPIYVHSVCGMPAGTLPEINGMTKRLQPRHAHYVDVGSLNPEDAMTYVKRVLDSLKRGEGDTEFLVVPFRGPR